MDQKPLTNRAGIMEVVRGVERIDCISSVLRNHMRKVRRNKDGN